MANENKTQQVSKNEFQINFNDLAAHQAINEHILSQANSLAQPANKFNEPKLDENRIRLAIIDNYLIDRHGDIDPLKTDHIINMKTGKVVIKWIEYNGGVIRPEQFGYPNVGYPEDWEYYPELDNKYPEDRTLNCYNHDKASEKEMLDLSSAFIWSNGKNWCGINYMPPVGSIVIVGFKKNNIPVILGFMQSDYKACNPLKPGEMMIKGFGDNYTHWRWSNKLDTRVSCKKGDIDLDDPYKKQTYQNDIELWQRFDTYTQNITFDAKNLNTNTRTIVEIRPESFNVGNNKSKLLVSNTDIYSIVGNSTLSLVDSKIEIQCNSKKLTLTNGGLLIVGNTKLTGDLNITGNINGGTLTTNNATINNANINSGTLNGSQLVNIDTVNNIIGNLTNTINDLTNRIIELENKLSNM